MISFTCDHCEKRISVADEHAGKPMKCKGCAAILTIPPIAVPMTADQLVNRIERHTRITAFCVAAQTVILVLGIIFSVIGWLSL